MFALVLARPIRQIDAVISAIGHGQLSEPVKVQGPSDLQALGRQLEWLRVRLQDIAEERNRFLRHMSHELKTPLANIREGTELLMEGAVGSLNGEQREVAGILRDNSLRLQRLIENLLSYSEWQAKRSDLEVGEIRLLPLVKSAIETYQLPLNAHRLRLDLQVPDLTLAADREKLQLILDNLISNAVKFTPDGGTITLRAAYDGAGRNLVLDVADTGPGIPLEERPRIFEAFYQGATPQGGLVRGTGIGLSVVQEFVLAHGGSVEIVDGEFPGAHFRVRLPLTPTPAEGGTEVWGEDARPCPAVPIRTIIQGLRRAGTSIFRQLCHEMTFILQPTVRRALLAVAAIALTACAGLQPASKQGVPGQTVTAPTPKPAGVASYFEVLDLMAPGDAVRQSTELASTLTAGAAEPDLVESPALCDCARRGGSRRRAIRSRPGGSSPNCSRARTT